MPKTKISEYSVTNSSNTDIEGINIDEGCAPSGINNAIRELMVHLKEFQTGASGDAFTFAGGVLISGTANTITGNVLMSGTNTITGSTTATFAAGAVGTPSIAAHGDTNTGIFFPAADTIAFAEGGAEAMRIDSSGNVLVGTTTASSTAGVPLVVARGASSYIQTTKTNATAGGAAWGTDGAEALIYTHTGTVGSETFTAVVRIAKDKSLALQGASPQTGTGITFPATQSASTDANTLDDYEEGTWTPTVSQGTVVGLSCGYTKIGRQVTVVGQVKTFSDRSSANGIVIGGLPFTPSTSFDDVGGGSAMWQYCDVNGGTVYINSTSKLEFYAGTTNGAFTAVKYNSLNNSAAEVYFIATYFTS